MVSACIDLQVCCLHKLELQIVPKMSAVVPGAVDTVAIALHKHHIDLVKYSSEQDGAFETVSDQLGVMIESAPQKVTVSWQHEMKMKSKSIKLDILNPG